MCPCQTRYDGVGCVDGEAAFVQLFACFPVDVQIVFYQVLSFLVASKGKHVNLRRANRAARNSTGVP